MAKQPVAKRSSKAQMFVNRLKVRESLEGHPVVESSSNGRKIIELPNGQPLAQKSVSRSKVRQSLKSSSIAQNFVQWPNVHRLAQKVIR
jgi:hypothetical protein